jgi:DNA segregation ATPase FtsK/SpoIIIE-like protein
MIDRAAMIRRMLMFVAVATWVFLVLSLGSYHTDDWPSHNVYPHPQIQNLCGKVGASISYELFLILGEGVFPILFFSGVVLAMRLFGQKVTDLWLRIIGVLVLSVGFAALYHSLRPGSASGLPEGYGGVIGIGASTYLQDHFNTVGGRLIMLTGIAIGLLLAADDLVLRAPGVVSEAIGSAAEGSSPLANLLARIPLPRFAFVGGGTATADDEEIASDEAMPEGQHSDEDDGPLRPAVVLKKKAAEKAGVRSAEDDDIELTYDNDHPLLPAAPAAVEKAFRDETAPPPSAHAVIPPPEQQVVAQAPTAGPMINGVASQSLQGQQAHAGQQQQPRPVAAVQQQAAPASQAVAAPAPQAVQATPVTAQRVPQAIDANPVLVPGIKQDGDVPVLGGDEGEFAAAADGEAPVAAKEIIVRGASHIKPRSLTPPAPAPQPKELGEYHMPGWEFLAEAETGYAESQEKFVREKAVVLEQALRDFNIEASVVEIDTGPVITMYEISLAPGIKVSAITALGNDIARALAATSVRIVAPVPGKHTVGIEVPNAQKEKVRFKELMQLAPEATQKLTIPLYLGKDASGEPLVADLVGMPHCLIAGTTGSGKSVCINTIIMSILYTQRPDYVKMILVDPKVVEMAPFKDIPHLMCPVINDTGRATSVLEWACEKMDERYELLAEGGCRNIRDYNKLTKEEICERFNPSTPEEEAKIPKHLPYIIIIIDELADLMMTSGKEVESFIVRLAQKSRAVGIHLILATQRPQANVVTGLIKSNMPSRIAFRVQSRMDSRIVLDQNGADLLLGQGDMLFLPNGANKPIRSQGTFLGDDEIRNTVKLVKSLAEAQYEPELVQIKAKANLDGELEQDDLFDAAVRVVLETKRGSVSLLQRRLTIGYGRAARLIEMMASAGILGDYKGTQARECTITIEEWEQMQANQRKDVEDGMSV